MNETAPPTFAGDKKTGQSILGKAERRFIDWGVPKVPKPILSHHLTYVTILWSAGTVLFGWLATKNLAWLHGVSVMVFGQWLTDSFDGSLSKFRKQGLVKWGFYMDHLLDFVFLAAFWLAYLWVLPTPALPWLALLVALSGALMAHSFLAFGATGEFRISHFGVGPTETRIALLALNSAVVALGPGWLASWLPALAAAATLVLAILVLGTQRQLWRDDFAAKRAAAEAASGTLPGCHQEV